MEKLLRGILKYKANTQGNFLVRWSTQTQKRQPPILFISCIDSRVLPTHFCQTSPGDMFILRSAGNMLPHANYTEDEPARVSSEVVALEITCNRSKVEHVIICGHSDCQALYAAYNNYTEKDKKPVKRVTQIIHEWCRTHGVEASLNRIQELSSRSPVKGGVMTFNVGASPLEAHFQDFDVTDERNFLDKLSKVNVLQQLEHLSSYHSIRARVIAGSLSLHGMWYDVMTDKVYWFSRQRKTFIEINEENIDEIVQSCQKMESNDAGFKVSSC